MFTLSIILSKSLEKYDFFYYPVKNVSCIFATLKQNHLFTADKLNFGRELLFFINYYQNSL